MRRRGHARACLRGTGGATALRAAAAGAGDAVVTFYGTHHQEASVKAWGATLNFLRAKLGYAV